MGPFGAFNGADGGNPFVSGLVNAVNIAGSIQQQGMAREQEARAKAHEARQQQIDEQNKQLTDVDLSTRLSQMGAKEATNQDLIDAKTGGKNNLVKFGDKQWVLPTEAERAAKKATDFKTKLDQDTQEAGAKADATERAKAKALKDRLDTEGVENPQVNEAFGWPAGTKVLPEHVGALTTAMANKRKADQAIADLQKKKYAGIQTDDSGNATVIFADGSTQKLGKIGKSKTAPRDLEDTPSNRRLTEKAANDSKIAQAAGEIMLDPAVKDFKSADVVLRQKAKADPFVKQNYLLIRKHIKDADHQTAAETNAGSIDSILGADDAPAGASAAPPAAAPAARPAAAPPVASPAAKPAGAAAPPKGMSAADFLKKHRGN